MSTESSSATVLAWSWVIQSIAKFEQVDSSILTDLVKNAPAILDELGKDAREMVSLRILESLFIHANEATVDIDGSQIANISFDPSERCEDVLHKILEGISGPMTELERQKWNVHPFILHKRTSLPKSPLQKFKEALLEGNHRQVASLKEMSKVGGENVSVIPEVDVSFKDQTVVGKDDLVSLNPSNAKNKLQERMLQKSDYIETSIRGITEHVGRKEHEITIEPPVIGLEENSLTDHVEHTLSKEHEDTCGDANTDHGQWQSLGADDNDILPNISISGPSRDGKKPMENGSQPETRTDSEKSDDVGTDIAAQKEAFLSSQYTPSQDSMATIDCSEICLCMKCNKDGQLLVCNSDTCPIRVHESCLGSAARFDENGNFFCPFCAYSHAISNYLEVKKKASLARKYVQAFLSSGIKNRPNIYSEKEACLDTNELRPTRDMGENVGLHDITTKVTIDPSPKKDKVNSNEDSTSRSKEDCAPADSPDRPIRRDSMPKRQPNEKESHVYSVSRRSKRSCKSEPRYITPKITLARRKNLPWSKSEEDVLQEGVQKFPTANKKGIPWKEILHFGRDVFDKSRTTIDLKDKWRNLCKGSLSSKKRKL